MTDLNDWVKSYAEICDNPPENGSILRAIEGEAVLTIELNPGAPPFIYGRAYVPEAQGVELKWYLQGSERVSRHGYKCILLPQARTLLLKSGKELGETVTVKALRVIRASQTGKSLLCEVHEL